jgi:hypothetical protein
MMLLGPGVTAATTAKRRKATTCSVVVLYLHRMRSKEARSGGEGLERSCKRTVAGRIASTRPVGGVELFRAWFAGEAYQKHRHDTYAIGLTGVRVPKRASAIGSSMSSRLIWPRLYGSSADGRTPCRS